MSHEHGNCMRLPCDPVVPGPLIIIPTAFNWRVAEFSTELVSLPPSLSVTLGSPRRPLVHMQLQRTDFSLRGVLLSYFSAVLPFLVNLANENILAH
jgi:hypothetical protein